MRLFFSGLLLLCSQIAVGMLSHAFVFGMGHAQRPIPTFLLLEALAFAAYFLALEGVRKSPPKKSSFALTFIFLIAAATRLVLFSSEIIQETDPYRYAWDGQTTLQGENPYAEAPTYARLVQDRGVAETTQAQWVLARVNHPKVKTVYPPFAQLLFAASQWLSPWQLTGWRAMILVAEIAILALMVLILGNLGMRREWALLYAWSPLALKEFANSLHLDVFAILLLLVMVHALTKERIWTAYVSLALASLIKWFPILLLPLLVVWTGKRSKADTGWGLVLFFSGLLLMHLPFLGEGVSPFGGLGQFATRWRVNDGVFGLMHGALSSLPLLGDPSVDLISRLCVSALLLLIVGLAVRWLGRQEGIVPFCRASLMVLASAFLLAPTGNPWYLCWILPFLAFAPSRALILLTGLILLYYLDFYFAYRGAPELFGWVRLVEYGSFFSILGWELWTRKRHRSPSCSLSQTSAIAFATR